MLVSPEGAKTLWAPPIDYNLALRAGATPLERKKTEQRIDEALQGGARNQATFELVRNWCRHARIRRDGGRGLVEEATGLPIGHVGMACDHAVAAGILSWDLADAAIDFHDRNCARCTHRVPVGFPNLATLVAERDARQERAERESSEARAGLLERRIAREAARNALRAKLPGVSASLLECLDELDQDAPGDAADRLALMSMPGRRANNSVSRRRF
jgi:hypothetical protein